jgi:hypothetical protein
LSYRVLQSFQHFNFDFCATVKAVVVDEKDIAATGDGRGEMDGIGNCEVVFGAESK